MRFSQRIAEDKRTIKYFQDYMDHPFIKGMEDGSLDKEKFKKYLIQDTLYLKDYGKVYAMVFLETNDIEDLQFLYTCIGVIMAKETDMHIQYLKEFNLDVVKIDKMEYLKENRDYLDYMLEFGRTKNIRKTFMSALPCTITYWYIGKKLLENDVFFNEENYYYPWMEAYSGDAFEEFKVNSDNFIDKICEGISQEEEDELMEIFLEACRYEMEFWNMSYK